MNDYEGILILIGLILIVCVFILPIAAFARSGTAKRVTEDLRERLRVLGIQLSEMQRRISDLELRREKLTDIVAPAKAVETQPEAKPLPQEESPPVPGAPAFPREKVSSVTPPPLPIAVANAATPTPKTHVVEPVTSRKAPALNFEQFLGVKLFAWLGGLALFFGVAFFIKYSFDHDLIPPAARVAIGFIMGAGLLIAGVFVHKKQAYTVLAQTFCASGVLILYGVSFGAHSLYHLFGEEPKGALVAFGLMALITAVAFLLAVRLNALVVAVLGMLGGFLTPILCSTGHDNPFGLFGYIALLDIGLLMVVKHRRWLFLSSLAATGTALMQLAWFVKFFHQGHYFKGTATFIPMGIVIFFIALFTFAAWRNRHSKDEDSHPIGASLALCVFGLLAAFVFLDYGSISSRTFLLYGYVFLINIAVLAIVIVAPRINIAQVAAGLGTFLHIVVWTAKKLEPEMLGGALVVYLVFGIMHAAFPIVWSRLRSDALAAPRAFSPWFPPLIIVLMLLPVLRLEEVSFIIWPAILLADLCVIIAALISGVLLPVIAALVLTLIVVSSWLCKVPPQITALPSFLIVLGGFAAVFVIAGCWLTKRYSGVLKRTGEGPTLNDRVSSALPVLSAALPFLLLIMATLRLPVLNPSPVFGLGLLLVLLLLGLAKIARVPALCLASLACMVALEGVWHQEHFDSALPLIPLCWYAGVHLLFTVYPFVFRDTFKQSVLPWAASAASGIGHFVLIYDVAKQSFPGMADRLGLVPAVFALPGIISLLGVLRAVKSEGDARNGQLAWFGGVALLFITLIFPIQFERQWLTLAWAMEGAALIWLFKRVPHRGLIGTGIALLGIAFARLALNPAVLEYYPRGATAILNWHLYSYTIAAVSMMLGARWLTAPNDRIGDVNIRAVLWSLGGVLLFVLLNIEIADYFTEPGTQFITLSFGGSNFARDMTYSMAWSVFALITLIIGFATGAKGARYAGIGLLAVTLIKLFVHDLASLPSIYRIGALMVVAVIALLASFLYQRFLSKTNEP